MFLGKHHSVFIAIIFPPSSFISKATAKILANKFNLPVIVVKSFGENNTQLIEFLASFNFDCVFFFDEFEKNFSDKDSSILQIMDGVYTSEYRRIFLLTTNETNINDNLISRPSRLRYIRRFYEVFSKCPTMSDKLSYSHYCEIIWLAETQINYYITITIININQF